jgi:hypothetical protein
MRSRLLTALIAAACLGSAAALGAEAPGAAAKTSPAIGESQTAVPITVTGCVNKETSILIRVTPLPGELGQAGMTDEFVVTLARVTAAPSRPDVPEPAPAEPAATSGGNLGKVYRITGDKESQLAPYIGQRVAIEGTFKHDSDAKAELGPVGTSGRPVSGVLTPENTPEITMTSVKSAAGACPRVPVK